MYLDSLHSQTFYGLTDKFKFSRTALAQGRRRKFHVLHLTNVKPILVTKEAVFNALYPGTRVDIGEFNFISKDGYLQVTNTETASGTDGIILDAEDSYAIPISYVASERVMVSSLDHQPEVIE